MKGVALYRVSTREQGDSGIGIENQVEQVQESCEKTGRTPVSDH